MIGSAEKKSEIPVGYPEENSALRAKVKRLEMQRDRLVRENKDIHNRYARLSDKLNKLIDELKLN
jgi:hypothetical protein